MEQNRALTVPEIKEIVKRFGETAYLCWKAGYDGVQVTFPQIKTD